MKLILPFPPTLNTYWRSVNNRVLISAGGRKYRLLVGCLVMEARANVLLKDRLSVSVDLYAKDRRRRDIDNYVKALLDALTHAGVWVDDEQIDELIIRRMRIEPPGKVVVTIEALK